MLKTLLPTSLALFLSALLLAHGANAQDTGPKDVVKEPNASRPNDPDIKGALKIETTPAVQPEDLNKVAEDLPKPPTQMPAEKAGSPHYYGLHAQAGLPHPVSFGLNYVHSSGLVSAEFNMGSFNITSSGVKVGMSHLQLGVRWHPFMGSFFLGANFGQRTIMGESTETINTIPVTAKVEVKSNYLMPHLGWMWGVADGGFFLGMEIGYLSPSGVNTTLSTNVNDPLVTGTQEYRDLEKDVKDAGDALGAIGLPTFTLLKLGWLF